jgi:hypothetical protein
VGWIYESTASGIVSGVTAVVDDVSVEGSAVVNGPEMTLQPRIATTTTRTAAENRGLGLISYSLPRIGAKLFPWWLLNNTTNQMNLAYDLMYELQF